MAATLEENFETNKTNSIRQVSPVMDDIVPIKLPKIEAASGQSMGEIPSPLRPEKRIGYAIVGLGHLALNQVMPALAKCKYSKAVA